MNTSSPEYGNQPGEALLSDRNTITPIYPLHIAHAETYRQAEGGGSESGERGRLLKNESAALLIARTIRGSKISGMKIVLLDTKNGMMFAGSGKYTTALESAVGFQDTALADEFRKESNLVNHNVAMCFCDACLDYTQTHVSA